MSEREISVAGVAAKWTGRATAGLLLAFWGMFFVEHLSEWFLRADGRYPPLSVWWPMGFHFLMLVGLALMLKWDKAGTVSVTTWEEIVLPGMELIVEDEPKPKEDPGAKAREELAGAADFLAPDTAAEEVGLDALFGS